MFRLCREILQAVEFSFPADSEATKRPQRRCMNLSFLKSPAISFRSPPERSRMNSGIHSKTQSQCHDTRDTSAKELDQEGSRSGSTWSAKRAPWRSRNLERASEKLLSHFGKFPGKASASTLPKRLGRSEARSDSAWLR